MGKFDKKAGKNEVEAPKSQKILKKKSSKHLHTLNENKSMEKDRNMKIFNMLEKKRELKSASKSQSYLDTNKIVKKEKTKESKARKQLNKK
mmetsp:Transcript_24823/g.17529  ORF Transcript_24823/g.17529 Transcript_24823/m.17529 type:complete len:91 (+) Transcript_24823:773-1045(+)